MLKKKTNIKKIPKIIAVSKTFPLSWILPLIEHGHEHFGENKVQESLNKWPKIKLTYPKIKLHMIGKLQSNKVKFVIPLFDYIHSLDNLKLAEKIASEELKQNIKIKNFIQINIGNEEQKSGIRISYLKEFYKICKEKLGLNIIGLMCLPPKNILPSVYFSKMKQILLENGLEELSMGMSNDYLDAVDHGSTFLRIGSKIFGDRN